MNNAQITNENYLPALPMQSLEELHNWLLARRVIKAIKDDAEYYFNDFNCDRVIHLTGFSSPYFITPFQTRTPRINAYDIISGIEHDEAAIQSHQQNLPTNLRLTEIPYIDSKSLGQQIQRVLRGERNNASILSDMRNGFDFEPIWAHVPMPERMSHSGKKQWEQVAFLTEKGLMFANDEAMFKYISLYQAGKIEKKAVKFYVDTTEWECLRRIFRYSQQLPVEMFVFYSAEVPNISSFEVINF